MCLQVKLLVLEGAGEVHLGLEAHKQRLRVRGQFGTNTRVQLLERERRLDGQRGHASSTIVARNLHAIHIDVLDSWHRSDHELDLARGHVLTLPSERVADAIDKVKIAALVLAQQITSAEPLIALLVHVMQNLLFSGFLVSVAL